MFIRFIIVLQKSIACLSCIFAILLAVKDDKIHDSVLKSHVLAMSGTTIEQGSKIGLGQTKNVAVVFAKFQVLQ